MTGAEIVSEIVNTMISGITGIGQGIGSGLSTIMHSIFMTGTGESETLSVFGTLIIVFCAISLGFTLCRSTSVDSKPIEKHESFNTNVNGSLCLTT